MYFIPVLIIMIFALFDVNTLQDSYFYSAFDWCVTFIILSFIWSMGYLQGKDNSLL